MSEQSPQLDPSDADNSQLSLLALKKAREAQALSIDDVSERLKISAAHLKALEVGDVDKLPGLAFARGYIRTYGRFLGLDADALILGFNAQYGSDARRQVKTISRVKPQAQLGDPIIRVSLFIFVLVIIGTSVWWWQAQMGKDTALLKSSSSSQSGNAATTMVAPLGTTATAEPTTAVATESSESVPESSGSETEPKYLTEQDIAQLTSQLEQTSESESQAETMAVAQISDSLGPSAAVTVSVPETEAVETSRLMIRFSGECWVSIKNSDGKTIFASLLEAGDTLEREFSSLPLELLIGSSSAVAEAEFRGQPLAVSEHSKKGVARLTLE